MNGSSTMRYFLTIIAVILAPGAASAQHGVPGAPRAAQCEQWAQPLGVGGADALDALVYGSLYACPVGGPPALASAIQNAVTISDTDYLGALATTANVVMDPAILAAASAVAGDADATDEARVMASLVLALMNMAMPRRWSRRCGGCVYRLVRHRGSHRQYEVNVAAIGRCGGGRPHTTAAARGLPAILAGQRGRWPVETHCSLTEFSAGPLLAWFPAILRVIDVG